MDRSHIHFRRPGDVVSSDHARVARDTDDVLAIRDGATRESRIPAVIRAFQPAFSAENAAVNAEPSAGYRRVPTAMDGLQSLAGPAPRASNVQEALLALLRRMEATTSPQRFTVTRASSDSLDVWTLALVAAEGRISPVIEGSLALQAPSPDTSLVDDILAFIWTQLGEIILRGDQFVVTDVAPDDPAGVVNDSWIPPVLFSFFRAAKVAPERLPLVESLRDTVIGNRATMILLRRDRDVHPLLRVHNIAGGDALKMDELEAMVRFGEAMTRNLAVLSGSAVPGASRWFGSTADACMMVLSMRDLTLVAAFSLDRLGRFAGLADRLESSLYDHE